MQALPQKPRSTTDTRREIVLADTLREATRFQLWTSRRRTVTGLDAGSLIAAFPWLEEAVQLIRAMGKHDANGIVITEGTRVLWTEGVDGALRNCASDGDAVDTVQELNGMNTEMYPV